MLHVNTVPNVLPSQAVPVPCDDPKFAPEIVTCVPPAPPVGETDVMLGAVGTVTEVVADVPEIDAVMVAEPVAKPSATPPFKIETTAAFDELHVTELVKLFVLPSEKVPVAVN